MKKGSGKGQAGQRFCAECNAWRPVIGGYSEIVPCQKHMRRRQPTIGHRITHTTGYVLVRTTNGYVYEHRAVWEAANGPIPDGFHIHHLNHVRNDNRIENLALLTAFSHNSQHSLERHADGTIDNQGSASGMWRSDLDDGYIVQRRNEGASFRQIGREVGAPHGTVAHHYRLATA